MLAVGVDAAAERVVVLERPGITGGNALLKTAVLAERQHLGAVRACDVGGGVRGAVVDNEDVGVRQFPVELVEHRGEIAFLVPGGDEDKCVAHPTR